MRELRFDGRVAVVTGAGRGLGRAYALLLAARDANVLVNDTGASIAGDGSDTGPAAEVVTEIENAGGQAVACTESVAMPEGGRAIIDAALERFGRIDVRVRNAGNNRRAPLTEMTSEDFGAVPDVHHRSAFHVVRLAQHQRPVDRCRSARGVRRPHGPQFQTGEQLMTKVSERLADLLEAEGINTVFGDSDSALERHRVRLAASTSGANQEEARTVTRRRRAGAVYINDVSDCVSPFGGYRNSGDGREWGEFGSTDYLKIKGIHGH